MVGALANGFSQIGDPNTIAYLDEKQYWPFWEVCEQLDVPFYLHPRNPLPQDSRIYKGPEWLMGPIWAFGHETAVHALRLMGSGLFDKHPKLQIVLGHMGEGLPFNMWRVDNRQRLDSEPASLSGQEKDRRIFPEQLPHHRVGQLLHSQALLNALMVMGSDRIMFSTDWPFENIDHAALWFDAAPIGEADRLKIGRTNALKLFKLKG